jgi:hypothetical protein
MTDYLQSVLATTESSNDDLVSVRKHITDCFETVDAFLLPHPGFEVVKKNYDGEQNFNEWLVACLFVGLYACIVVYLFACVLRCFFFFLHLAFR